MSVKTPSFSFSFSFPFSFSPREEEILRRQCVDGVTSFSPSPFKSLRQSLFRGDALQPPRPLSARGQVRVHAPKGREARVTEGKGVGRTESSFHSSRRSKLPPSEEKNALASSRRARLALCFSSQRLSLLCSALSAVGEPCQLHLTPRRETSALRSMMRFANLFFFFALATRRRLGLTFARFHLDAIAPLASVALLHANHDCLLGKREVDSAATPRESASHKGLSQQNKKKH